MRSDRIGSFFFFWQEDSSLNLSIVNVKLNNKCIVRGQTLSPDVLKGQNGGQSSWLL